MRALTVLLFISLKKLNAAEYLNLMSRLRVLIETATPEALGLTAAEFASSPSWWTSCNGGSTGHRRAS